MTSLYSGDKLTISIQIEFNIYEDYVDIDLDKLILEIKEEAKKERKILLTTMQRKMEAKLLNKKTNDTNYFTWLS